MSGENLAPLRELAEELMSSSARQNGPQNLDLLQMLSLGGNDMSARDYFIEQSPPYIPSVQAEDCRTVPRAIRELYSQVECDMFMGLFPEIHRAWISIDNRLFLWNYYHQGEDFYVYDGLDQLIVSVGLVRPKPGLFPQDVEYLLVISTPVEIVLLQVRFLDHPKQQDLELYPTDFNIPSDNTPMRDIKSTEHGRIFMAGHDGLLYEYVYERPSVMHSLGFKRQCRKVQVSDPLAVVKWVIPNFIRNLGGETDPLVKVEIDHQRNFLYTISERGVIALYNLGAKQDELKHICTLESLSSAGYRFLSVPNNNRHCDGVTKEVFANSPADPFAIVSFQVIKASESDKLHAMAISSRGIRFYLTTSTLRGEPGNTVAIAHIRGPPGVESRSPTTSLKVPCASRTGQLVSKAFYESGVTLYSFVPGQEQQSSSLSAYSTDLAMRATLATDTMTGSFTGTGTGLGMDQRAPGSYHVSRQAVPSPPMEWQAEAYHEVVDAHVLVTELQPSVVMGRSAVSVGRIWDITEELVNPQMSDEEDQVHAHMLQNAKTSTSSAITQTATVSTTVNGNGKRPLPETNKSGEASSMDRKNKGIESPIKLTELVTQHMLPRRKFLVLTSKGLWSLTKQRPVNKLYSLIQNSQDIRSSAIIDFFRMYGLDESCEMCLAIACSNTSVSGTQQVQEEGPFASHKNQVHLGTKASNLFIQAGYGVMQGGGQQTLPTFESLPPASSLMTPAGSSSRSASQAMVPSAVLAPGSETLMHSGCFTGLCLNIARLFRPFWDWSVVVGTYAPDSPARVSGTCSPPRCRWTPGQVDILVQPLERLEAFMRNNAPFRDAVASQSSAAAEAKHHRFGLPRRDPLALENAKVQRVYVLLNRARQALRLLGVLGSDTTPLDAIMGRAMTKEQRGTLQRMTMGALITTEEGLATGCLLINGLMSLPGRQGASEVKQLVQQLQDSCPLFFTEGDAFQTKAAVELSAALRSEAAQRSAHLAMAKEALHQGVALQAAAYRKASPAAMGSPALLDNPKAKKADQLPWQLQLAVRNIQEHAKQLVDMHDVSGAIALALHCAACYADSALDQLPALAEYTPLDRLRVDCYQVALDILGAHVSLEGQTSPEFRDALGKALGSNDRLWHFTLYQWLLHNGHQQLLMEVDSPYVVSFLQDPAVYEGASGLSNAAGSQEHRHAEMHLLVLRSWLKRHGRNTEAVLLLRKLAVMEVDGPKSGRVHANPTLEQRIDYFSEAITLASAIKSSTDSGMDVNLARLKDELDIAELQRSVYKALESARGESVRAELEVLKYTLIDPSALYNDYAYHFQLWEQCIEIMKVCDSNDPQELESLLRNIIRQVESNITNWEGDQWIQALSSTLVHLGRRFYDSRSSQQSNLRFKFPLYFCVEELEDTAQLIQRRMVDEECDRVVGQGTISTTESPLEITIQRLQLSWNSWVVKALQEIEVDFVDLFQAYCQYNARVNSGTATIRSGGIGQQAERYDERSKLYAATALCTVIEEWLGFIKSPQCPAYERKDFEVRIHSAPTLGGNNTEGALRDRIDQLTVLAGTLHGENVLEDERTGLNARLKKLSERLWSFRA